MSMAHTGLKNAKRSGKILSAAFSVLIVVLWSLPVLWMVFASLDENANVFIRVPSHATLENFQNVVADRTNQQAVFNSMLYAMGDLGDIMLVIALMVAMLRSLEAMGADQMMIAPAAKLLKTPRIAFWVIAAIMYVCASFFWPTPATALVGTILIPVALKAGLAPMMACIAMNLAGHGMALSGDLVLQGAPKLSATAANVDITEVLKWGGILATGGGCVTRPENRRLLRQNGKVIWLQRDICRLEAPGRPLLRESGLSELYRQRCALYEHFSDEAILNNGAPEDALRRLKECMV